LERKEEFKMPTKTLEREETLAANSLRSLSQKSLMEMVSSYEKLGLIVNNELQMALLSWENYEEIVDLVETQNEKIEELESMIEDMELAFLYGERANKAEKGESKSFEVASVDELFSMLD
jgi:hypothetical protein